MPLRRTDFRRQLRSTRGRVLDAMAAAVAEHGYANTTVSHVLDAGSLSRRTFYAHFRNKEACFLAAYDFAVEHVAHEVVASYSASGPDPQNKVIRAFETFVGFVVCEPDFARLCLIDVLAAGPAAETRRAQTMARFASFLDNSGAPRPTSPAAPAMPSEAIVGGVQAVLSSRLIHGRAAEIPALLDELLAWCILPVVTAHRTGPAQPAHGPARPR